MSPLGTPGTLSSLAGDLRQALRALRRTPGFTVAAVLTLSLGIGLLVPIASAVHAVLWRPLDLARPGRLYTVWQDMTAAGGGRREATGRAVYAAWRERNRGFAALAAFIPSTADLNSVEPPENVAAGLVSHEYFRVLGVGPALGRDFLAAEETRGRGQVVVLAHGLWVRRFGRDPALLGRTVTINAAPYTVVGVMPPGFQAPLMPRAELWMPMPLAPPADDFGTSYVEVVGRLAGGVSPAAARSDMARLAAALAAEHPGELRGAGASLAPLLDSVVGAAGRPLLLLLAAAALVLLVAAVNAGNLFLTRALGRDSELALRLALGAGRARVARQLLLESLLVALAAAAFGLLLGGAALALLRGLAPPATPRLDAVRLGAAGLAWTAAAALAAGLVAGLLPALRMWRRQPFGALRDAAGASSGRPARRLRGGLIVAEIAASVVLVAGSVSLLRTLAALARVDPGVRTGGVALGRLTLAPKRFPAPRDMAEFLASLEERLARRPEIAAVGIASSQPLADAGTETEVAVEAAGAGRGTRQTALYTSASPGFFRAAGLPLVAGRPFTAGDGAAAPPVALVNRSFARRWLGGRDPLGRRLRRFEGGAPEGPWRTIVGVVGDVRGEALDRPPRPELYVPLAQEPAQAVTVVARASGPTAPVLRALRQAASGLRPGQVVARPATMEEVLATALAPRRLAAGIAGSFAGVALLLAAAGIHGVAGIAVAQRRREIAVRLALGARPAAVVAMVLGWSGALAGAGAALGLAASLAAGRALGGLLYGVQAADPLTLAGSTLLLALVAFGATLVPALRAARLELAPALRSEA
jgi:putative ABC transport system permease protein